jgi:ATP-dependent RNA helicase SUPV3L1/SUV3
MLPVLADASGVPVGYRLAGGQVIRVDLAEKILRSAFDTRAKAAEASGKGSGKERNAHFRLDLALAVSIGLEEENARRLLGSAGFRLHRARALAEGAFGPPAPDGWTWRPRRAGEDQAERRQRPHRESQNRKGQNRKEQQRTGKPEREKGKPDKVGKPKDARRKTKPHGGQTRPDHQPKPDTGPARARGAFDSLAELLRK